MSRPTDIAGAIISVVVDAVEHIEMVWPWFKADVVEKGFKIVTPFPTDLDTASAIMLVVVVCWIIATVAHVEPCSVFDGLVLFPCMPMNGSAVYNLVDFPATTTTCISSSQIASTYQRFLSAITVTIPANVLASVRALTKDSETTKSLASHVNKCWHGEAYATKYLVLSEVRV